MSYDLYFARRSGILDTAAVASYFSSRRNYKADKGQTWYQNEDTGVYFVFNLWDETVSNEREDEKSFPIALNINFFRPSYFILEAEPEVTAFAQHFDLSVFDPQIGGMGEGEYRSNLLIAGWNEGNAFGYKAMLSDSKEAGKTLSLPAAKLIDTWKWNSTRAQLQNRLGPDVFVPRIMFFARSGEAFRFATWPDGIPTAVPKVDFLFVPRKRLAPRKFLKRTEDKALVLWNDAAAILKRYDMENIQDVIVPNFISAPADVARFIELLPTLREPIQPIPCDQVLDRELVEKAVAAPPP